MVAAQTASVESMTMKGSSGRGATSVGACTGCGDAPGGSP